MGSVWGQSGLLMLRGYAEIVTHSGPTRCEVCKAFGSARQGARWAVAGVTISAYPQHEEPRLPPAALPEKGYKRKNRPKAVLSEVLSDQLRLGIKVPASANTEFGAVIFSASTLGRAKTPLRTDEVALTGAGSTATPLARCSATS